MKEKHMHIKEYIAPILISTSLFLGIQYFFGGFVQKAEVDTTSFTQIEQQKQEINTPLLKIVSYDDQQQKQSKKENPVVVEFDWGKVTFLAGNIVSIEYKKIAGRMIGSGMKTLFSEDNFHKQTPSFLVAFEEKTPLFYDLKSYKEIENHVIIVYAAQNDVAMIQKTFTLDRDLYQMDMAISVTPKKDTLSYVRLLFQSPYTIDANGVSPTGTVLVDKKQDIVRTKDEAMIETKGWIAPRIFGTENQYFTNICFKDAHHDISRAYYVKEEDRLISVLEFAPIDKQKTIELSFYLGPKESDTLAAVDSAVADVFAYKGILSPLYKLLFFLLKWLYSFFGDFGISIILLTIFVRLLLLPFALYTERSQKAAKEFEKKMQYITQKYKNNEEQLQLARAELVKNQGFSLLQAMLFGIGTQIPLFFCLNYMFGNAVELFNAPFLWIPSLSGKDPLYILPLFVMGSMIVQSPSSMDAKKRLNTILFALVVGALATRFSAGLGLYFVVSGLFGLLQTFFFQRFMRLNK
jgi:YidC/Oxa1 family membrane protein insertase